MTGFARLFSRIVARPLAAEPLRTALIVLAVALGTGVVVGIRLASEAATGSFRSSMETLAGDATLEIVATGGVDERLLADLVTLPHPLRFVPRIEGYATVEETGVSVPLAGLDLVAQREHLGEDTAWDALQEASSIWSSSALEWKPGDVVRLATGDRVAGYRVRGVIDAQDRFIVMDIGAAQQALDRAGLLDRIEVHALPSADIASWQALLRERLPAGVEVRRFGAATEQNRRMLEGFRWNLRVLSYISLVVGAFLIYNAISVSVVRRRAEIGVLRAIGATRMQVRLLFLAEAEMFGVAGSVAGLVVGVAMARFAVGMLAATVEALYVSSTPGSAALTAGAAAEGLLVGIGVSLLAAFAPAREASLVPPVEAMARGQREHHARIHTTRNLALSAAVAAVAAWASQRPAWDGKPVWGYAACFLLILAAALAIPALVTASTRVLSPVARRLLGVEGMLAARGMEASLARTSVLVGALATAVAMMVSVGIMVGSFRETVSVWTAQQLRADLYLRPAGGGSAGRQTLMDARIADDLERLPSVLAVDRFRLYDISYRDTPALLGAGQTEVFSAHGSIALLPGPDRRAVLAKLPRGDYAIVSEPFANKHGAAVGDRIRLPVGAGVAFEVLAIYADYSNERGYVIVDRETLLRHLPDPAVSSLAVYLRNGVDPAEARNEVERVVRGRSVVVASNRDLRENAMRIFDRTFAITWALEAVAILVAVLGIAGALLAMVIDRRREIGLLRFLGGSAPQIRRLLLCEAGLLGLLANTAGLLLGWLLSLLLIYVINKQSFGWTIQFHWPVTLLVSALSLVLLATVIAGLYPARVAVRLNPIEVIHEE